MFAQKNEGQIFLKLAFKAKTEENDYLLGQIEMAIIDGWLVSPGVLLKNMPYPSASPSCG